jgi:hypothetical protein
MIYQELSFNDFRNAFIRYDRNVFSYEGYQTLFDYLNDTGEDYELDVIALCCEFNELSFDDIKHDYRLDFELSDDEVVDWLNEQTSVIYVGADSVLFGVF